VAKLARAEVLGHTRSGHRPSPMTFANCPMFDGLSSQLRCFFSDFVSGAI